MPSKKTAAPRSPALLPPSERVQKVWHASKEYMDFVDKALMSPNAMNVTSGNLDTQVHALHQALLAVLDHEPHHLRACVHPSDLAAPAQQPLPLTRELFEAIAQDHPDRWATRVAMWRTQFADGTDQACHAVHGLRATALLSLLKAGAWQEALAVAHDLPSVYQDPKLGSHLTETRAEALLVGSLGTPCQDPAWATYAQEVPEGALSPGLARQLNWAMDQGHDLPLAAIRTHWGLPLQAQLIVQALLGDHPGVALALWTPAHPPLMLAAPDSGESDPKVAPTKLIASILKNAYPLGLVQKIQKGRRDGAEWAAVDQWCLHQERSANLGQRPAVARAARRRS